MNYLPTCTQFNKNPSIYSCSSFKRNYILPYFIAMKNRPFYKSSFVGSPFPLFKQVLLRLIPIFIFALLVFIPYGSLFADGGVVILRSQNLHAYNLAIEGFISECEKSGIEVKSVVDMAGKFQTGRKMIKKIMSDKEDRPDLFLAVGVLAATLSKKEIKDVPVVFCMVVNYQRFRLEGENISGISSEISELQCFKIYKNVISDIKTLGVIYDRAKTEKIVERGVKAADLLGINLIKGPVRSSKEVKDSLAKIADSIDALWLAPDSTVISKETFADIYNMTLKAKIPILCTSDVFVKAGALIGVYPDYVHLGVQTGKMAKQILSGAMEGGIKVQIPEKLSIAVNKGSAKKIKALIPHDFYEKYDVVEFR